MSALQIKVTLRGVRPPVWRRILVDPDATLDSFHRCLQVAFGWANSHMHAFRTETTTYAPAALADAIQSADEKEVTLGELFHRPGEWVYYEYDFGDGWAHRVLYEREVLLAFDHPYPWVLAGRRACPPENVGGPPGYEQFLEAMAARSHPEHPKVLEWNGRPFDPTVFDLAAVNRTLHPRQSLRTRSST